MGQAQRLLRIWVRPGERMTTATAERQNQRFLASSSEPPLRPWFQSGTAQGAGVSMGALPVSPGYPGAGSAWIAKRGTLPISSPFEQS